MPGRIVSKLHVRVLQDVAFCIIVPVGIRTLPISSLPPVVRIILYIEVIRLTPVSVLSAGHVAPYIVLIGLTKRAWIAVMNASKIVPCVCAGVSLSHSAHLIVSEGSIQQVIQVIVR